MNYFIIILFVLFPVFSFAADEDEKENKPFILDQSRLDSGATLGGVEPDVNLVEKAEAGDVEALVRLYQFYQDNGESQKADSTLHKAAEKGHIPSLKLIYQQTGEILSAGVEAAVNAHVFAPLRSSGGRTEFGLMHFSYMDHLSSRNGLEESESHFRSSIISQITDGEKNSLVETKTTGSSSLPKDGGGEKSSKKVYDVISLSPEANRALHERRDIGFHVASSRGDRMLRGQPVRPVIMELTEDGTFQQVELKLGADGEYLLPPLREGAAERSQEFYKRLLREKGELTNVSEFPIEGGQIDSLIILGRYTAYRLENSETQMEYWLGRLKNVANTGDMLALQMVYRITGEVLTEGYTRVVSNTIDSFFYENREKGISPKMTAMQNRESVSDSVMEQIKTPFVEGVEGIMLDLYETHQAKGDVAEATNWLDQLKKRANEGNVQALRIVYHITGEVLAAGLNSVVGSRMNSLFTEGREQGVSPKMTAMQNREEVRNNIIEQIKAPLGRCEGGF